MKLGALLPNDGDAVFVVTDNGSQISAITRYGDAFYAVPAEWEVDYAPETHLPLRPRRFKITAGWTAKDWKALPADHPAKADRPEEAPDA